jgi:hypothetical protein
MPVFELICLANSRKLGQRCVAGLTADTAEWIRPVSQAPHGELTYHHRNLGPAGDPQNFDIIRIGLAKHSPTSSQPENWLIDGSGWQLVSRPAASSLHALLNSAVHTEGKLFGTISDHVPVATFSSIPASKSLALVKPESSRWFTNRYGKARVLFTTAGHTYDLAVTDPPFEAQIRALEGGHHKSTALGIENEDRVLFTISLGEPFEGNCYKLVAAVLVLPLDWPDIP